MADLSPVTSVAALYVHPERPARPTDTEAIPMIPVERVDAVTERGLRQDDRYFRRPDIGRERKRQVSLIDEGTIRRHEAVFGPIDRSLIKAQIILNGDFSLPDLVGSDLLFEGGAVLTIALMRKPCYAMDLIAPGLKDAMENGMQGALAMVVADGPIEVGTRVEIRPRVAERAAG
jgi:hypothetical protein